MSRVVSIEATLDAAGGGNDSATDTAAVDSDTARLQVRNLDSNSSVSADFDLEARLSDDLAWQPVASVSDVGNGSGELIMVDLTGLSEVRVHATNDDSTGGADVRAELETV